jgi:RHS repeat-associated protein
VTPISNGLIDRRPWAPRLLRWVSTARLLEGSLGGLILMGARLYNNMTGRFESPDPIRGGNSNAYTYPTNPIGMSDPSGMSGMWVSYSGWTRYTRCAWWDTCYKFLYEWTHAYYSKEGTRKLSYYGGMLGAASLVFAIFTVGASLIVGAISGLTMGWAQYAIEHKECVAAYGSELWEWSKVTKRYSIPMGYLPWPKYYRGGFCT